jgi:hypothetical protein
MGQTIWKLVQDVLNSNENRGIVMAVEQSIVASKGLDAGHWDQRIAGLRIIKAVGC